MLKKIVSAIDKSNNIAILYHVNADGDAVGSSLALAFALNAVNKNVDVYCEEEVQKQFKFLKNWDKIIVYSETLKKDINYDLCICIDCGGLNRLGKRIEIFNTAKATVNIDHHSSNDINADFNFVQPKASSSGELIFELIRSLNVDITEDIAENLYVAIATDSGNFKFGNTSAKTHSIAAKLIECGVNPGEVSKKLYDNVPFSRLKLLGKIIDTIELFFEDKISFLHVNADMMSQVGANSDDLDNIANYGLSIENVELSVFIKDKGENKSRISLRSKNYFDCSEFARQFGGGGHVRAAGFELNCSIQNAKKFLCETLKSVI